MSWIQDNKVPAAILGVSAAGAIGLGYMLFSAYSSYNTSLDQFDTLNNSLASLKSSVLPPTPENVALKQSLVKEFTDSSGKLNLVLKTLQPEEKPTSDTEFQAKLKSQIAEIKKLAAERGVQLPAEFNLAFDRYTGELPKSGEVATQLSGYLDAVNQIIKMLIEAGVARFDLVERSELPSEKDAVAAPAPKRTPTPAGRPGAARPPVAAEPPKLAERRQVRLVLTTDQAALQVLMSKLASPSEMPYFTVVRLLRIENEKQEGPLRSEMNIAPPALPTAPDAPKIELPPGATPAPTSNLIEAPKPAAPDSVAVLGQEKLRVFLEIDIVKFLTAQAPAAGTR